MITTKFQQFPLPADMLVNLEHLAFLEPTPVQSAVIPAALEGKDILATAQTGTGKTAAFGIPLLTKIYTGSGDKALVLAPTRELGAQIYKVLRQLSNKMNVLGNLVVGGESFNRQADELTRGVDYVVATPGRLNDHLQEGTISLSEVTFLVLDEVDRMLDMGFLPQIQEIIRRIPVKRQTLLFSATMPKNMLGLAGNLQTNAVRVEIGSQTQPAELVQQTTIETTMEGKNSLVLKELIEREGKILIFTRTKARTERLARFLEREGQKVVALHGDKHQSQRKMAIEAFRKGRARILVATDIAGRGIDVPDIEHVINYDLPMTREDYIHRIGRTGRLGRVGQAITFLSPCDRGGQRITTGVDPRKAAGKKPHSAHARPHGKPRHSAGHRPDHHAKPHRAPKHFSGPKREEGAPRERAHEPRGPRKFDKPKHFDKAKHFDKPKHSEKSESRHSAHEKPRHFEKSDHSERPRRFEKPKYFGKSESSEKPRRFGGPQKPIEVESKQFRKPFKKFGDKPFRGPKPFGGGGGQSHSVPRPFGAQKPFKKFGGGKAFGGGSQRFGGQKREDGFTSWRSDDAGPKRGHAGQGPRGPRPHGAAPRHGGGPKHTNHSRAR